jgi:hypothetical protein
VTCLYSAWVSAPLTGEPQLWQNRAFSKGSVPHVRHVATVVIRPSANPGPRFSQDRRLDTSRGAVGVHGDSETEFCETHISSMPRHLFVLAQSNAEFVGADFDHVLHADLVAADEHMIVLALADGWGCGGPAGCWRNSQVLWIGASRDVLITS